MGKIINIIRTIVYTFYVEHLKRKYNINEKNTSNTLVSKKKKRVYNKIKKVKRKRAIAVVCLIVSTLITGLSWGIIEIVIGNNERNIAIIASNNIEKEETNKIVLFKGEAECDVYGRGDIVIEPQILEDSGIKCNGTYKLNITYTSYETYSLEEEEMRCSIIAMYPSKVVNSEEDSTENTEKAEAGEVKELGIKINGAYKEDKYESALSYKKKELTRELKTEEIYLYSTYKEILEDGIQIRGYNWIITEITAEESEQRKNWTFSEDSDGSYSDGTSIEPQSRAMKNWYSLFRDLEKACDESGSEYIAPWTIFGTILREVGNTMVVEVSDNSFDYTIDLSNEYRQGSDGVSGELVGNSSNGYGQYEKTTWISNRRLFGNLEVAKQLELDSTLSIYRPNCWYIADQLWTTVQFNVSVVNSKDTAIELMGSQEFQSLDTIDKQFIYGVMCEIVHNRGHGKLPEERDFLYKLIGIAQDKGSYGMSSLYDMANVAGVEVWKEDSNTRGVVSINESTNQYNKFDDAFGINSSTSSKYPKQEYGYIEAMCAGYEAYIDICREIEEDSEKGSDTGDGYTGGFCSNDITRVAQYTFEVLRSEGHGYEQEYKVSPTFGTIRTDCSGYVTLVLYQMGMVSTKSGYTSRSYRSNVMGFEVVPSIEDIQPGDIAAWNGHVQMFAGYGTDGKRYWYSYGSDDAALNKPIPYQSADSLVTKQMAKKAGSVIFLRP